MPGSGSASRLRLGVFFTLLAELFLTHSGLTAMLAAAASAALLTALLTCCVLAARSALPVTPGRVRTALRERAKRTAFLPQRDPDSSGRPRPRAPGRRLATTV